MTRGEAERERERKCEVKKDFTPSGGRQHDWSKIMAFGINMANEKSYGEGTRGTGGSLLPVWPHVAGMDESRGQEHGFVFCSFFFSGWKGRRCGDEDREATTACLPRVEAAHKTAGAGGCEKRKDAVGRRCKKKVKTIDKLAS